MKHEGAGKWWIGLAIAIVAVAIAAMFDRSVAQWAHDSGAAGFLQSRAKSHAILREILKSPGWFPTTIAIALIVSLIHRTKWRAGVFVFVAGLTAGSNEAIKFLVGRIRPFRIDALHQRLAPFELHPFHFTKNLSFPSGHATLAFATATALGILWPRGRWAFYLLASLVAVERFLETAHWFSDTLAGAALGIAGGYFVAWLLVRNSWLRIPG